MQVYEYNVPIQMMNQNPVIIEAILSYLVNDISNGQHV